MGRARIIVRPTPIGRKIAGQINKMFGLWKAEQQNALMEKKRSPPVLSKEGRPSFLVQTEGINQRHITRRQVVLNRHFTEILSDVLSIDYKQEIQDLGIKITGIETKAWNKGVSIFYFTGKPFDQSLHDQLNSLITKLRYSVAERRLLGHTPLIQFVHDGNAEYDMIVNDVMDNLTTRVPEEATSIINQDAQQVASAHKITRTKPNVDPRCFSAPADMANNVFGLDYPSLYNEVVSKLERGRGVASRMPSGASLFTTTPLFKDQLNQEDDAVDPLSRIKKIQRFVVAQRKKNEHLARVRRKQEILARDDYSWEPPEDNVNHEQQYEERCE